jgi:hypothetical protein
LRGAGREEARQEQPRIIGQVIGNPAAGSGQAYFRGGNLSERGGTVQGELGR